ncbi:Tex family protein [Corynebacterium anserum]|uniref:S1 RNA-binding domain-containing protein n=1 Tax=Corynebacterium anserum TaxID=2684406 RepID=A0A7G7YR48_9CORY|nr:Tex family protein [Corynebacterium anserum]MBC2681779.1 S1 RNA-binding domain-containing protein [Corynebacterium anserum]QNH96968.1 S1 RNA-binding domain-containing protein [Corynebacterium anserum]
MIAQTIAEELGVAEKNVVATIALLDEGNTVPFIARYRKEMTGGLDDSQLRTLESRLQYLRELEDRKTTVLESIDSQGKLTDELKREILAVDTKARLEDLYLPYKTKRRTKASIAREAGLEPLARQLLEGVDEEPVALAAQFLTEGFDDASAVLTGARHIVVEDLATNADIVGRVRQEYFSRGYASSSVVDGKKEAGAKYRDYFDFSEPFHALPSHRILALLRGEKEGVLHVSFSTGDGHGTTDNDQFFEHIIAEDGGLTPRGDKADQFRAECVRFAWRTKLSVSSAVDVRMKLKEKADRGAVEVFSRNVKDLLLAAPAGQRATLGLDPGYRNGVKCAVVDATGKVLDTVIVYPHSGTTAWEHARTILAELVAVHHVELLAVGNGTASRETEKLAREVAELVSAAGAKKPQAVIVSEAGASVYSASEVAATEFPEMDVALRGAVSIARRLQDPLAELVKIDPKSIGVGQYQHDVNQTLLAAELDIVVEDAVNSVGVDLNTASTQLLQRVAGVNQTVAENIVAFRDEHGAFQSRKELLKVPRLGPKAFQQAAGFLRIREGLDPLDASAVHPEAYPLVHRIVDVTGLPVPDLIGNSAVLAGINPADFADETFGIPTVTDVLSELDKPGRDPRPSFKTASLADGVEKVTDLVPGMVLEGTVTNVAAFGAFVDVGVHHDGLVHISAMSDTYVNDPHDVVSSGQVVRVRVIDVDVERNRISLSLRLGDEASAVTKKAPSGSRTSASRSGEDAPNQRSGGHKLRGRGNRARGQATSRRRTKLEAPAGGSMAEALRKAGFGH